MNVTGLPEKATYYFPDIFDYNVDQKQDHEVVAEANRKRAALYTALRHLLQQFSTDGGEAIRAAIPKSPEDLGGAKQEDGTRASVARSAIEGPTATLFLGVYGLMIAQQALDPSNGRQAGTTGPEDIVLTATSLPDILTTTAPAARIFSLNELRFGPSKDKDAEPFKAPARLLIAPQFVQTVVGVVKEYNASSKLFGNVLKGLEVLGYNVNGAQTITVFSRQLGGVARRLIDERVDPNDPQLQLRITTALSLVLGDSVEGLASAIDIRLPDLDAGTTVDIIADNVRALGSIYFASQLEELKFFSVADRVVEHFMSGMLPISRGPGGDKIYQYMKEAPNRFTQVERLSFYERAFGFATGGGPDVLPNREFSDLWLRFLSAVSIFNRQSDIELKKVTSEQALKSARDLAVNLSLHGFGIAHFAAVELQSLVNNVKDMLSSNDVLSAYGVRDVWQLVDRVSSLYLGGASNGVRYRTTAQAGARIMLWLADNASVLASVASTSADAERLFRDTYDSHGAILVNPLKLNVERWLAVTATADQTVEKFSAPAELQSQMTIPTMSQQAAIPDALRGMLGQVGNMTGGVIPNGAPVAKA